MEKKDSIIPQEVAQSASQEHDVRVAKMYELRKRGIEPWPASATVSATAYQVIEEFSAEQEKIYQIAGRVMAIRLHGKTSFAHVQDSSGMVQVYIKKDLVGDEQFDLWQRNIDVGDIAWFKGPSFKTKTDEVTIKVAQFKLLSKCLHPLPEKFHGLTDVETRYRQRYLDLITNPESRRKFKIRSQVIRFMRDYLDDHGYMEVETPMLHPIAGGALAKPFITHHNALDSDFYLRIAPELYLKRLVVGGFEKVYEINRNFRNEGISTRHNPEFTMLEFYTAHKDYHYIMDFVEDMLRKIIQQACGSLHIPFADYLLDFEKPFERMSVKEAVLNYGGYTEQDVLPEKIDTLLKKHKIDPGFLKVSYGEKLFALFEKIVEPQLIQPIFITDYPIEVSPLAKRDQRNSDVAARFELFMGGFELANGFNELNDPIDQAQRFKDQISGHEAQQNENHEYHEYDAEFVTALEYGLPPTVGVGIGIDRLTMLLTNTTSIKDVILFPTLKKR